MKTHQSATALAQRVRSACIELVTQDAARLVLGSFHTHLLGLLVAKHEDPFLQLSLFSMQFRPLISRGVDLIAHFDPEPYHTLVDAITWLCDSQGPVSAFPSPEERALFLNYCSDCLEVLEPLPA